MYNPFWSAFLVHDSATCTHSTEKGVRQDLFQKKRTFFIQSTVGKIVIGKSYVVMYGA